MSGLFKHQTVSLKFLAKHDRVFDLSEQGTGKTRVQIEAFAARRKNKGGCALVLAPKSLLHAAWANDFKKFAPTLKVSIAWAHNRKEAFDVDADIYVTNVDAVKDLLKLVKPATWKNKFDTLIIDESSAFKHHTSQRSRALAKLVKYFPIRRLMSGTPNTNGICNLWHQIFLLDDGKRLGKSFFAFRSACCIPTQTGPQANILSWEDKPGIEQTVTTLISDIVIRHRFADCVDIPENHHYALPVTLAPNHLKTYCKLEKYSLAQIGKETVSAINGAVLATKLLQAASGAVYDDSGGYSRIATERYELVGELIEERAHTVCFYLWKHQLEELIAEAKRRKLTYVVWDPNHPEIEQQFQAGHYQVIFGHPQSIAHGLTFTRATATIWPSPTYNLEHFEQGWKRIHRIGQTKKTETIVIVAEGTIDEKVWAALQTKKVRMDALFDALRDR